MSTNVTATADEETGESTATNEVSLDRDQLQTQLETLQAENQRLREQYTATQQQAYRRTALGLAGVGALAGIAGFIITPSQQVLFALAGIGVFAAVLTWFLTPGQFIPISLGEAVYSPLADNFETISGELGLSGNRYYLESESGSRLYIPEGETETIPSDLDAVFSIGDSPEETGMALHPTGRDLVDEFEETHSGPIPDTPIDLSTHLAEGLVDGLELADNVETNVDVDTKQIIFEIRNPKFGSVSQFDHPIQSFLALGISRGLETPVTIEQIHLDTDIESVAIRWLDTSDIDSD